MDGNVSDLTVSDTADILRLHQPRGPVMSALDFKIIDLDFPVGSKNKTATLITGEREAMLVDAGFTRADGHRLVGEVLDSGRTLTTVFISHADPDYYWGA